MVTNNDLTKPLGLDVSTVNSRVNFAIEEGYLLNNESARNKEKTIVLGDPMPDDVEFLPSVESLGGQGIDSGYSDAPPPSMLIGPLVPAGFIWDEPGRDPGDLWGVED